MFIVVTFNRVVNLNNEEFRRIAQFRTQKGPLKSSDYTIVQSTGAVFRLRILDPSSLN